MINRKRTVRLLALIVFALTLSWLTDFLAPRAPRPKDPKALPEHDYRLENIDTRKFRKNGKLQFRLKAHTMTHYPEQNSSLLTRPVLVQYAVDGTIVETRADEADLGDENRTITMRGNVITLQRDRAGKLLARANAGTLTLQLQ